MWYKIEVNKDGSVSNCTEVEGSSVNGKRVYYVEADNKTEALSLALHRYQAYLQTNRERMREVRSARKARGECRDCSRPCGDKTRCDDCNAFNNDRRKGRLPAGKRGKSVRHYRIVRHSILLEVQKKLEALSLGSFRAWLRSEIFRAEPNRSNKEAA